MIILKDLKEMPGFNTTVPNGIDSVSKGLVFWTDNNKVTCHKHGAMLCVSEDRKIWRCPACNVGGYLEQS